MNKDIPHQQYTYQSQPGQGDSQASTKMPADIVTANTTALLRAFDLNDQCIFINKAWLDFTGRDSGSEHNLTDNFHPNSADEYKAARQKMIPYKKDFNTSYLLLHHSGQYRWVCEYSRPIFLADGTFSGYLSTGVDMHDQKSQSEYFTNKWSSILKTYFHDLRGTVSIVSAAAELLQIMDKKEDRDSTVDMIRRNSKRMQTLIDQLLDQLSNEVK